MGEALAAMAGRAVGAMVADGVLVGPAVREVLAAMEGRAVGAMLADGVVVGPAVQ